MNKTMVCSDERLRELLQESDDSRELQSAVEHLDHCEYCQSRIQQMAAELKQWDLAKDSLSSTGAADATEHWYRTFQFKNAYQAESIAWSASMAKQLLGPPSHPEMLGRLGRYEIERLIGSGGMGIVFKAFDSELNRPVAIKMLAPYLAGSSAARKRFAREARAAAAIVHDHVVPIHNVETEQSHPFLVMQYIAGDSLQARIDKEGPLDVCEILRIGKQVASGLAAAHAQGLIHRDVKPSNIMLDENVSRALLTDFGLARAEDEAALTRSGFQPGTPHYMSPEQIRAESIDGRSDLFSLGCVLYALCTGHPPFRAEGSYAVMRCITDDVPRSICELNPLIPNWLEHIVMKLLIKQRVDRYQSAAEVADLLEACLAHVQQPAIASLPDSLVLDSRKPFTLPSTKWLAGIVASLAVILIAVFWNAGGNGGRGSSSQVPVPAAPAISNLDDLVSMIAKLEQSYFPFDIKYKTLRDPEPGKEMSETQRGAYPWYDGRRHESEIEDAQVSIDNWFHKETVLTDGEFQQRWRQYREPNQEVQISEPKGSIGPNPTNEAQLHISTKPRIDQRINHPLVLSGVFPQIFMQSDWFLSKAITAHAVDKPKLSWDGEDAVLEFEYQQVPESMRNFCKVWYSRKYGWHPIRFQKFFNHDRKTWHTQWIATKINNENGSWRVQEGSFTYHDFSFDKPLEGVVTSSDIFQVSEARYGSDAAKTSMEYAIPEKAFIIRDGVRMENADDGQKRPVEVKLVDLNDKPIASASVRFTSKVGRLLQEAQSDQNGIAKTENGISDTMININAPNHRPFTLIIGPGSNTVKVPLLPRTKGRIVDAANQAVPDATIVTSSIWFRPDGYVIQSDLMADHSDKDGRFTMNHHLSGAIPKSNLVLNYVAYEPSHNLMAIAQVPAKEIGQELQLVAKPVCRISGSFTVPGKHSADEFSLWVDTSNDTTIGSMQSATSFEEGTTTVSYALRLPAGSYRVHCDDRLGNYKGVQELNIAEGQKEYHASQSALDATEFRKLVGQPAPELNVKWRAGDETSLAALKGKVVVIDFWGDWCIPCVEQMPALISAAEAYKGKGVEWIAVHSSTQESVDGMVEKINGFVKDTWNKPFGFHAALDTRQPETKSTGATESAYKIAEWPTVIVIKPDGTLYGRVTKDTLPQVMDELLKSTK